MYVAKKNVNLYFASLDFLGTGVKETSDSTTELSVSMSSGSFPKISSFIGQSTNSLGRPEISGNLMKNEQSLNKNGFQGNEKKC